MGTATKVPQTRTMAGDELSADDAWATLRATGTGRLIRDSLLRLRYSDGFSHSRALALQMCLTAIPGMIALVGLAATEHDARWGQALRLTIERFTPASGRQIVQAALQGAEGAGHLALWLGLGAAVLSLTVGMGQIERGANRIYGVERDRPFPRKYGGAFARALLAGLPIAVGMALLVAGGPFGQSLAEVYRWSPGQKQLWDILRWPVGAGLAVISVGVLFRKAPRRRQPGASWLAVGAAVSLALWMAATALLGWYVGTSSTFSATYGPLTAVLALLLWANLSAVALFAGIAFAAQLEACRTGVRNPIKADTGT